MHLNTWCQEVLEATLRGNQPRQDQTVNEEPIDYDTDEDEEEDEPAYIPKHYKPVPIIGTVAVGLPMLVTEDYSDVVRVEEDDWEPGIVALRLQGDSIEQDYSDGSVVLVRRTDSASAGI